MKGSLCLLLLPILASAASVDGTAIHYTVKATVTGGAPATVILVHGVACDGSLWSEQIAALSARYRVVTIDLPGHGKTKPPAAVKLSMDMFAGAIEAVREELLADRVVLAGHSMGTSVILHYTRLHPERVRGLIIVDGRTTFGPGGPGKLDRQRWLGEEGRKTMDGFVDRMFVPSTPPAVQDQVRRVMLAAPQVNVADALEAYYDPAIWKDEVLTKPMLSVYSLRTAPSQRDYIKAHFPNVEHHEIPDVGHFLMLEKPAEFNNLVRDFLSRRF